MTLSLCIVTKNSADYIEKLLRSAASFADEIVVAVDSSSTDQTEEICGRYADKLLLIEPIGYLAPALGWLHQQCSGDWILRMDDDELVSEQLVNALPRLMSDREITHYWLRRRWIVGKDERRWISQRPWWTDWALRMHRNIPSIAHVPVRVHTRAFVQGAAGYAHEGCLYHMDLVYHDKAQREEKVRERYEKRAPGGGLGYFYFPEEDSVETEPIPVDDPPLRTGSQKLRKRLLGQRSKAKKVSLEEIRLAGMHEFERSPRLFRARLECLDCPQKMISGEWYPLDIRLTNESNVVWPLPGLGLPEVRVGYHWLRPEGDVHEFVGFMTALPRTLWPGNTVRFPASVQAPQEPGDYVLQWDLAMKDIGWFTKTGWEGPEAKIVVSDAAERH